MSTKEGISLGSAFLMTWRAVSNKKAQQRFTRRCKKFEIYHILTMAEISHQLITVSLVPR